MNGVACEEASTSAIVNVTPVPTGNLQAVIAGGTTVTAPVTLTICPGEEVTFTGSGGTTYEFLVGPTIVQARSASNTYVTTALLNNDVVTMNVYSATGSCTAVSNPVTITYAGNPVVTLSSSAPAETFCTDDSIDFTATSSVASSSFAFYIEGTLAQAASSQATFTSAVGAIDDGDEVTVIVTTPAGCSETVTLTMIENGVTGGTPTAATASTTICSGEVPASITVTGSTVSGTVSYRWQESPDNITFTNITGVLGSSATLTPTTGITATTYYRRLTISTLNGVACEEASTSAIVNVTPVPTGNLQAVIAGGTTVTAPVTLTICPGEEVTFTGSGGTTYEFLVGPTIVQARSASNTYVTTALLNNDVVTMNVYSATGSCTAVSNPVTITYAGNPVVTLSSSAPAETFCTDESIDFTATSSVASSSFAFYIEGTLAQAASSQATFTSAVGAIDDGDEVTVIVTTPAGCSETVTLTMIENAITSIGTLTTASSTICSGETATTIVGTTSNASGTTIAYEWQNSLDNITYTAITGSNSSSYDPGTLTTTMFFKRRTISTLNGVVCDALSNALRIDVTALPPAGILANPGGLTGNSTMTICDGDEVNFTGSGGASYEFTVDGITRQARSNQSTFTTTGLLNNEVVRVVVYDQPAGVSACNAISDPITIVVNPVPTVNLSSDATGNTFCVGDIVTFNAATSLTTATYTFAIGGVTRQTGASSTFVPTDYVAFLNDGDVIEVSVVSSGSGCSASTSLTLIQNTVTAGTIATATPTICTGGTPSALTNAVSATGAGAITYQWEAATAVATYTPILSATNATYTPTALVTTTFYRRKAISTFNGAVCEEYSNVVQIAVTPLPVGGTVTPTAETICSGETPSLLRITGGSTGPLVTYQWQESTDGFVFTDITTATSADYQPPALNATRWYKRITNAAGGSPASCNDESSVIQITVLDIDAGALDPSLGADYCFGAIPPTLTSSTTGGTPDDASSAIGTVTYRWEMSTDNATWSTIPSATNNFYNPPSLIQTTWYRRVATVMLGADTCEAETNTVRIGILPDLNEGRILDDQMVCQAITAADLPNPLELRNAEPSTTSVTYQWQISSDQYSWQDIAGQQGTFLTFTLGDSWVPTAPATYYRAVITYVGSPAPAARESTSVQLQNTINTFAAGQVYSIAINGNNYPVTANASSTLDSIGAALATLITNNDLTVNATFNATNNILSIIPVAPGTYNVAASTGSPDPILASIVPFNNSALEMKVLVSGNNGARTPNAGLPTCQVYTESVIIEVDEQPTLNQISGDPSPEEVCIGDPIDPITFEFGGGATSVEIRNLDTNLNVVALGGGAATPVVGQPGWYVITGTNTFTISGSPLTTSNFTIVTQGSCTPIQEDYLIRVEQLPRTPDFIRMNQNSMGYEILQNGGIWYNNTICQDRDPAPTTPQTEFFACYVDNAFNQQYGMYTWDVSAGARNIIPQDYFRKTIDVITNSAPIAGQTYTVTLTNATGTVVSYVVTSTAAIQTNRQIGLAMANLIDANPDYEANYNNTTDEIRIFSAAANQNYTVVAGPTDLSNASRFGGVIPSPWIRSVIVDWDPSFSGTSTVRVRTGSNICTTTSAWLPVEVHVVPQSIPQPLPSDLLPPVALNEEVCGGEFTGPLPVCEISVATLPTQFFTASNNPTNFNDYGSLEWRIANPQPGSGSSVGSPGTIDQDTGILTWNVGWWGTFELEVRPISCTGVNGNWTSVTIVIGEQDGPLVISNFGNPLPECPIPAGGFSTTFSTVGAQPARWYVNSTAGLDLGLTNFVASATFIELAPTDASSSSVNLNFRPGYSGNIVLTAEPTPCRATA